MQNSKYISTANSAFLKIHPQKQKFSTPHIYILFFGIKIMRVREFSYYTKNENSFKIHERFPKDHRDFFLFVILLHEILKKN